MSRDPLCRVSSVLIQILFIFGITDLALAMWPQPLHYEEGTKVLWFSDSVWLDTKRLQLPAAAFQAYWSGAQSVLEWALT